MKISVFIVNTLLLLVLCACSSSNIIYGPTATEFLICDFNKDGKPEKKYIEGEANSNEQYLIIEQEKKIFLRIPYYSLYKEPYFNTQLAIIYGKGKRAVPQTSPYGQRRPKERALIFLNFRVTKCRKLSPRRDNRCL